MSNWRKIEDFEAELLGDEEFRARFEEQESDYQLAREIIAARLAARLTQASLAQAIGTSQSRVSKWERGEEVPRIDALRRIAKAAGRRLQVNLAPPASAGRRKRTA